MPLLVQFPLKLDIQIAWILLDTMTVNHSFDNITIAAPHLLMEIKDSLLPVCFLRER